jgi:uncharacterized protein (DUF488 family)
MDQVWTIGYQGRTIDEFVHCLQQEGITAVVDVRRRPISRRPGFSKSRLKTALAHSGIQYFHFSDLGMPPQWLPLRNERDGNRKVLALYRGSMNERETPLQDLSALARRERICLVCFEADADHCHRSVLADALGSLCFGVCHLH